MYSRCGSVILLIQIMERSFTMTELRRRMIENMRLRGLSPNTQRRYVDAIRDLAKHYHRPPDQLREDDIRDFFVYMKEEQRLAGSTIRTYLFAVKFLYKRTLGRQWPVLDLIRVRTSKKLPTVLSPPEARSLLRRVRRPAAQMSLIMMYTCGLRVSEATRLHCRDIDSRRMVVCVRNGKGAKDRYVPLPGRTLKRLRTYWCQYRPKTWLFPSMNGLAPINPGTVRRCLKAALNQTDINKNVTCHTLRHSYATHLMEKGVDLRVIQALLGHRSPKTTFVYMHLTQSTMQVVQNTVNDLMARV